MDPISALNVACAVVQFVDFSGKVLSKGRELYQSHSGALAKHEELDKDAHRVTILVSECSNQAKGLPPAVMAGMNEVVEECNLTAALLVSLLKDLKVKEKWKPGSQVLRVLNTGKQAVRTIVKQSQIKELDEKLMKLRTDIQGYVLAMLQHQSSAMQETLNRFSADSAQTGRNLAHQLDNMREEIIRTLKTPKGKVFGAIDLEKLVPLLPRLVEESRVVACKAEILSSLSFPEMKERYSQIKETEHSFHWILQPGTSDQSRPDVYFVDWLRSQKANDNTYWISGKPGSGKSTLMKFLYNNARTKEVLTEWAYPKKLVIAGFYFWVAGGSELLKTRLGLLRSLVYELFWQNPDIIPVVCPEKYEAGLKPYRPGALTWSLNELLEALRKATTDAMSNARFCFFIDGLDECKDDAWEMVELIEEKFPKSPDIKFCLASRKRSAFIDEYGDGKLRKESPRHLYLEDLTRKDIREFVQRRLRSKWRFTKREKEDPDSSRKLLQDVVNKAEGVFLWVHLVVESLIRGIQNEDNLATLQDRLDQIPSELPDYFGHMLKGVEPIYRSDAAKIYQIMLNSNDQPYLSMFAYLEERNSKFAVEMETKPQPLHDIGKQHDKLQNQLNARCTDLLDVVKNPKVHPMWEYKVAFTHRTVGDYMRDEAQDILGEWLNRPKANTSFNPNAYICQSLVAQIKRAPLKPQYLSDQGTVSQLVNQFAHSARKVQENLGDAQIELMNALETTLEAYRYSQGSHATTYHTSFWYSKASFLQWAVKERLDYYVNFRLNEDPTAEEDLNEPTLLRRRQTLVDPDLETSKQRKSQKNASRPRVGVRK